MLPEDYTSGEYRPKDRKLEGNFKVAAAKMEDALASALNAVTSKPNVSTEEISKVLKLILKKEIILEFLLEEVEDEHLKNR